MDYLQDLYRKTMPANELRDIYNRFNFSFDLNNSYYNPAVSEHLYNKGFKPTYPNGAKFAICITHDIDEVFTRFNSIRLFKTFKSFNYKGIKNELQLIVDKRGFNYEGVNGFIDMEKKNNIHSTYYFLSLTQGEMDYNYSPNQIQDIFKRIINNGSEIALHGGHEAAYKQSKIKAEKTLLENGCSSIVKGYRGHYLKFDFPNTWRYLQNSGIIYDSTFSYPDVVGFRNGMCYPFLPLGQKEKIIEIPLIASDHIFDRYMRTDQKSMTSITKHLLSKVSSINGVFTLLWHNSYFEKPFIELFEMILEYGKSQNAWFASGIELSEWWQSQGYFDKYSELAPEIFEN
jgi:hypothetical protein